MTLSAFPCCRCYGPHSFDGTIRLWNLEALECIQMLSGHKGIIYSVSWAPGGRRAMRHPGMGPKVHAVR